MKRLIPLVLLSGLPLASQSHEFLSEIIVQLQGNSGFVSVAHYNLSKAQILALNQPGKYVDYYVTRDKNLKARQQSIEEACSSESNNKTCGQFDHFSQARSAAITICYELSQANIALYPNGLVPVFTGPNSFVDAGTASVNHHDNYLLDYGLEFDCSYKIAMEIVQPTF